MQLLPFGMWPSPISAEMLTLGAVGLVDVWVDGDRTIWLESRPAEGGRLQLVVLDPDGTRRDLLPDGFSARSGVHEYGGGAAWIEAGSAWFVNWGDQRIYRTSLDGRNAPVAITPEPGSPRSVRFADLRRSPDGEWITCVRERHLGEHDVRNDLVAVRDDGSGETVVIYDRSDFVMSPRFTDAATIRLIAWEQPSMPWDTTRVVEVEFRDGAAGDPHTLADGAAYMEPCGAFVLSDRSDWWNVWELSADAERHVEPVAAEIGGPAWVFGSRSYAVLDDGRLVSSIGGDLVVGGEVTATGASSLEQFAVAGPWITAIARFTHRHPAIVRFHADQAGVMHTVVDSAPTGLDADDISEPVEVSFSAGDGTTAHAWYYPPRNALVEGPPGDLPPLVTMIHGGPTAASVPHFSLARQFWTSRGFAVVDVNHRGSTGYGREFRSLLDGQWGVVDVEDCCAAATWLAEQGRVAADRIVIRGGSAGGFTVLSCLARSDVFAAGASLYGVADLMALATDTHKFEARYLDGLIGALPAAEATYRERSPIEQLDRFDRPLIVFQGADDQVVPPSQSEAIVEALRRRGVRFEYHLYEGEGHGFRKADTIVHQLSHELAFYRSVLGLDAT